MNSEYYDLWEAMKGAKYSKTCEKLAKIIRSSDGNLFDVMGTVLSTVAVAMHTAVGTLWFCDPEDGGLIRPKAVFGGGDISNVALLPGEGIAGQVIQTNQAEVITDCQKDPRWAGEVAGGNGFITRTMICVPLSEAGKAYGCIQLINKQDDTLFDDKDFDLAEKLAQIVSEEFNSYRQTTQKERMVLQAVKNLEALCAADPETLQAALEKMDGYNRSGSLRKNSTARLLRNLVRNLK